MNPLHWPLRVTEMEKACMCRAGVCGQWCPQDVLPPAAHRRIDPVDSWAVPHAVPWPPVAPETLQTHGQCPTLRPARPWPQRPCRLMGTAPRCAPPVCGPRDPVDSQAVHHAASLPPVVLLLPLLPPADHFEQRALVGWCVLVGGPADVLEVLDYAIPILRLRTERLLGPFWGCSGI